MKEIENNKRQCVHNIHKINTSNKPPTRSMRERHVLECTYTNGRISEIEKARTRTFRFKNVRLTDHVGL